LYIVKPFKAPNFPKVETKQLVNEFNNAGTITSEERVLVYNNSRKNAEKLLFSNTFPLTHPIEEDGSLLVNTSFVSLEASCSCLLVVSDTLALLCVQAL